MIANAGMNCDGYVSVHATNDASLAFTGSSGTASSWIVKINLDPGGSTDFGASFGPRTMSVSGAIQGVLSDGTSVRAVWSAARPADCGAPPPVVTAPVDTTPHPLPTTPEDPTVYCAVPGANPPMKVPCDDPLATTPYQPAMPPTTAPEASAESAPVEVATDTDSAVQVRTGPPKTHATVAKPASLPVTGTGTTLAVGGGGLLVLGAVLVCLTQRRVRHA